MAKQAAASVFVPANSLMLMRKFEAAKGRQVDHRRAVFSSRLALRTSSSRWRTMLPTETFWMGCADRKYAALFQLEL
jgi:hypothetical protein